MESSSSSSSASSSSSSSSSTLSAKARPFVPPQSSTLSAKSPPFTKPNNPKLPIGPLIGEPYYPIYDSLLDSDFVGFDDAFSSSTYNGDDVLEPSCDFEGFHGLSVQPWDAPFDQEVGQLDENGVTSSLWTLPSLDPQGARPKVTITPYKVSRASTSTSASESCNASNSNSCYNDSVSQIYISCANPVACHPYTSAHETSSTSDSLSKTINRVYALPEVSTTSLKIKHEEGFDGRRRACNTTDTSTATGDSSTMKKGAASSNSAYRASLAKPIKLHKASTSKMSTKQDDSLENSSEMLDQLDVDVDSPCWKGTPAYQWPPFSVDEAVTTDLTALNSASVTDEAKDQPHIPTTAGHGKTTYYLEKPENLMSEAKKGCTFNSDRSLDVASSSRHEKCEDPCTIGSESSCKRTRCLDTCEERIADMMKDQGRKSEAHGKGKLQLDQEVAVTFTNHPKTADDLTMSNSSIEYAAQKSSSNSHTNAVITNPTGASIESYGPDVLSRKASFTGEFEQIIDETLQCLRKRLLSRAYRDKGELNGLLNEVLLLVNDYPKAYVLKNNKGIANGCYEDSGVEAAPSQSRVLKGQGHAVIHQSNKDGIWDARGIANGYYDDSGAEVARSQSTLVMGQGNAVIHHSNIDDSDAKSDTILIQSNFKTSHDTDVQGEMQPTGRHTTHLQAIAGGNFHVVEFAQSQDYEKILKKNFCEHEDNFRSLLHKNLWIEAEAKLLSMKYELKLARAEIEILKHRHCTQGRLQEVNRFSSSNYWQDYLASNPLIDTREKNQKIDQDMSKREEKDTSPLTRLGVLRIKN